ncbi:GNAT family N-acetyltransferase [Streptomyces sp. NPDC051132]|uniref:GNAT family N-acetyltransferase n=1 Tax=unclassified Streptomyces TaxID=2593676 RepID=UPI0034293014
MVTLRALTLDDALALTRIYSGASIRHTTGKPLTLDQAHDKIRTALARAAESPRAQWSWGILAEDELIGLIALRRRTPSMGTISYILREDSWGNGYATHAANHVVSAAFTTAGLTRLEAMHHPDTPPPGASCESRVHPRRYRRLAHQRRNRPLRPLRVGDHYHLNQLPGPPGSREPGSVRSGRCLGRCQPVGDVANGSGR